jgi:hypothetical protein
VCDGINDFLAQEATVELLDEEMNRAREAGIDWRGCGSRRR